MGWNASFVVVKNNQPTQYQETLKELGFSALKPISEKTFEEAISLEEQEVYIGTFNNHLIICADNLPIDFFEDNLTATELKFNEVFPKTEICAFQLYSSVNFWGFAILRNGNKLRAKAGSADDGVITDYGKPIDEEKELLSKSTKQKDGSRTYILDNAPDEIYTEDQVGENFVFSVSKRYFGEPFDSNDKLLFETNLKGFSYSSFRKSRVLVKENDSKLNWRTGIILFIIILLYELARIFFFK